MSNKIRIEVKSDKDEAEVLKQKLILKGYSVNLFSCEEAQFDGTDVGGNYNYLRDIDDALFILVAEK